jgi:hypothetical protein
MDVSRENEKPFRVKRKVLMNETSTPDAME